MKKSLKTAILQLTQMVANYEENMRKENEKMVKDIISNRINALLLDLKYQKFEFDVAVHHIDAVKFIINSPLNNNKEKNEDLLLLLTQSQLAVF